MKKKKFIIICSAIVASLMLISLVLILTRRKPTYTLENVHFNQVVSYNGELDLDNLSIIKKQGGKEERIVITPDMIVSGGETNSIGTRSVVIQYENQTFSVDITVKYRVEFVVNGEIVSTQYVVDENEIVYPNDPELEGCEFIDWESTTYVVNDNTVFYAKFKLNNPLKTFKYDATFGDTLADFKLPKNEYGEWKFIDDLSTQVGDVQVAYKNFDIEFVPYDLDCIQRETGVAQIKVKKKELQFKNVSTIFYYDSNAKTPTYEIAKGEDFNLDINNVQIDYNPYYSGDAVNAGVYSFNLYVNDPNFSGRYNGSFEIKKVVAKVIVGSFEIGLSDEYPQNFPYVVQDANGELLDEELVDLMNIQIIKPYYQHANKYEIGATVNNSNFDWSVESGCLTVNKVELNLDSTPPTFVNGKNIEYGSLLESVEFVNDDVRGTWVWEDPSIKVLTPTAYVAKAKFIPFETGDYLISSKEITLEVQKKELKIEILNNKYVYDGANHNVQYNVVGLVDEDDAVIVGNVTQKTAGNYDVKLAVDENDLRYIGATSTSLIIEQKSISDFSQNYAKEWNKTLKLEDIELPVGYAWVEPLTPLTDIGEQSYLVQFTPDDVVNYKTEKNFIKVDVYKATAVIESPNSYEFEYNPNGYSLNAINLPHSEVELKIEYKINGNAVQNLSSVGEYEAELILEESEHYNKISKKVKVVINKVKNTDIVLLNQTAIYEDLLSKFSLPNNNFGKWQWKDGANAQVGVVGKHVHIAEYVPNDLVNYESREVGVSFDVIKKEIILPTIQSKVFNNQTQVANVSNTKYYNVIENNGGINKGNYDVVVELIDFSNYCWSGEFENLRQVTLKFEILKNTTNAWVKTPSIAGWKYGEIAKSPVGESLYGDIKVEYKSVKDTEYLSVVPTKAGSYVARFSVAETENFVGLDYVVYEFNIDYIVVPVPSIASKTYNGEGQNATISETAHYSVTSNEEHVNAGEYDVVLTLKNDSYKWPDSYELNKTISFVINKVQNSDVVPTLFEATYKDTLNKFTLPKSSTGVWSWVEGGTSEVGNAGVQVHKIVFTPFDETNFMGRSENVEIKVAKKIVQQPTFSGKTFNGENQIAEVAEGDDYIILENNGGTEAGKYDVVFQLKDPSNYRWAVIDENESELTLSFEILKNEANKWEQNPSISGWTYGQDKSSPVANSTFGDVIVEYKLKSEDDSKYSEVKPTNAGDYVARFTVAGCDSYSGLTKLVEFRIEYVVVSVPSITSKVFNGAEQLAEITQDDRYSILTECLQYKNAGNHEITIKLNNPNYKWTDSYDLERIIIFEIKKVQNKDVVILTRQAEYSDVLKDEYLPISENGVWQWVNKTTVGNVGNQTHVAKFIPNDPVNYASREVTVTFEVSKKVVQKPIFAGATYNGSLQVANVSSNEIYKVVKNDGGIEKGEYDVVFELIHPESYRWAEVDENQSALKMKFKISTVVNIWTTTPSITGWKYGEKKNEPIAESLYGDVIIEYKLSTQADSEYSLNMPSNAGVYFARFSVAETESYNDLNATVEFKIEHIVVSVPEIENKVYNGSAQIADVPEKDYYDVVSNIERTNAGEYDVVIKLNNVNYKWPDTFDAEKTLTFVIEKVKNNDEFDVYNALYEDKLSDHELIIDNKNGEWAWKTGDETLVGKVGTQTHVAVFTPYDETNYESREVSINFNVAKRGLLNPEVASKEYNGEEQLPEIEESSLYSVDYATPGIVKGEYDVQFRLTDSENYEWRSNPDSQTVIVKFNILKSNKNKWNEGNEPSIIGWKFGEAQNNPSASALFGDVVVEYRSTKDNDDKYSTTKPIKAGSYLARFSVAENDSFNGLSYVIVEFEIEYVVVQIPVIESKTYNGQNQIADILASDEYDVVLNDEHLNAGEYQVKVKLNNDSYKWPDSYELEKTLTFVIDKVKNEDVFETYHAEYTDSLASLELLTNSTGVWSWKSGDETLVGEVGNQSHVAMFTPNDKINYESREVEVVVEVSKKSIEAPSTTAKEFNNKNQTAGLESTDLYQVESEEGFNVGDYDVELTILDFNHYCWKNDKLNQTTTIKFNIIKNNNNDWNGDDPTISGWTYFKEQPNSPTGEALFGDLIAEYKLQSEDDSKYSLSCPENVGSYVARFSVADCDNYNGLDYVYSTFVIEYCEVGVPTFDSKEYNGKAQKADIATADEYNIIKNELQVDAGKYEVIVELINSNFKWVDSYDLEKKLTFEITKSNDNDWVSGPTMNSFTYTPTYNSLNEATANSLFGTVQIKYLKDGVYLDALPVIVGTYTAEFTVADCDNYNGLSITIDFNITQATPTISGLQISTVAYENSCEGVIKNSLSANVAGEIKFDLPKLETTSKSAYSQATYLVDFTPSDTHNYKTLTDVQGTINLYSVCYSGSTYYGSIENALAKVTSGTITVIPNASRDVTISKNVTIPSKVTLSLPYLAENGSYSVNKTDGKATLHLDAGSTEDDKANAVSHISNLKLTTRVVIKNGVTLTNNGTLMIAGETSGGRGGSGLAGHTARNFAEIELEPNAKIISTGTIHCFGFIDVSDLNDTSSQVIIQSGKLYMPFVIADFRGGTFMKEAYQDLSTTPFNQFELRNIVASLRINQGAVLIGHGNLYAQTLSSYIGGLLGGWFGSGSSSKSDNNYAEVKLVGGDSNYLIQLTSGAYIEGKYTPDRETIDNNNQWTNGVNILNFYGGAKTNSLKMKVVSVTLNTSSVAFPLSWRFKINLYDGNYTMTNAFKLMPGAELTVQKGATLTVDSLNIYDSNWSDTAGVSSQSVYKASAGAPKLIVRGTLISNNALGGIVYSDTNDAIVQVKGSISASTNEVVGKSGDKFTASAVSNSLCLKSATNIDEAISTGTFASSVDGSSSSTYKMINGLWVKQ